MTEHQFFTYFFLFLSFVVGACVSAGCQIAPRIYKTFEPLASHAIDLKRRRMTDRYEEEKAIYKKASS